MGKKKELEERQAQEPVEEKVKEKPAVLCVKCEQESDNKLEMCSTCAAEVLKDSKHTSDSIRTLLNWGLKKGSVAKILGIRYQYVFRIKQRMDEMAAKQSARAAAATHENLSEPVTESEPQSITPDENGNVTQVETEANTIPGEQ